MYQLKTGRQLEVHQEFNRRLLSEYNPHFTLGKYVAYLELKKIIGDIVIEQARYDSMCEKLAEATERNMASGHFGSNSSPATMLHQSGMFGSSPHTEGGASSQDLLRRKQGTNESATQAYSYLIANRTPLITGSLPLDDDMPTITAEMSAPVYAITPTLNLSAAVRGHLLAPKDEDVQASRDKLQKLHAKFFEELKGSHRRVKSFLIEKEKAAVEQIEELRKHSEQTLAKLMPNVIPNIYRRVRNIALFRDLNTVAFQRVMQKYFQLCCTTSLEQQEKVRIADSIIAGSHLCKPTFDADQQLDLITAIYATVQRLSYEDARHSLDLAIERDLTTHQRIMPVTKSYFYAAGFVHHQNQGSFALKLISGIGSKPLTKKISNLSHSQILNCDNKILPAGELAIKVNEAVRGDDVYVIQSMAAAQGRSMSTAILQLALSMQTLSLASAARVTAVIPYMAYNSNPNASAAVAEMLMINGCRQVLTLDLTSDQVEGMFGNLPIYSVTAVMEFISYLTNRIIREEQSVRNLVVVSPNGDGVARARRFADAFAKNLNKELFGAESNALHRPCAQISLPAREDDPMMSPSPSAMMLNQPSTGSGTTSAVPQPRSNDDMPSPSARTLTRLQSTLLSTWTSSNNLVAPNATQVASSANLLSPAPVPSTERVFIPIATALKRPSHECNDIDVIGDVKGQHCYIVDTVIDEAVNATTVAKKLKQGGALRVTVVATHALLSSAAALDLIEQAWIDELIVTDTIEQDEALKRPEVAKKLRILSVAPLLAEAVQRLHSDNCLSTLFDR
eukprot:GILI01005977.1.p1 GENE.GILI01005977.1~~GILI01005977.1.p1  ORF type:complete len:814 (-),score=198.95 GILI01005977.1:320-2695(-)